MKHYIGLDSGLLSKYPNHTYVKGATVGSGMANGDWKVVADISGEGVLVEAQLSAGTWGHGVLQVEIDGAVYYRAHAYYTSNTPYPSAWFVAGALMGIPETTRPASYYKRTWQVGSWIDDDDQHRGVIINHITPIKFNSRLKISVQHLSGTWLNSYTYVALTK